MTAVKWFSNEISEIIGKVPFSKEQEEKLIYTLEKAKEMEAKQKIDTSNVSRVEVIQHSEPYNGRAYTNYNAKDVEIQLQDSNKTLKIFLK